MGSVIKIPPLSISWIWWNLDFLPKRLNNVTNKKTKMQNVWQVPLMFHLSNQAEFSWIWFLSFRECPITTRHKLLNAIFLEKTFYNIDNWTETQVQMLLPSFCQIIYLDTCERYFSIYTLMVIFHLLTILPLPTQPVWPDCNIICSIFNHK